MGQGVNINALRERNLQEALAQAQAQQAGGASTRPDPYQQNATLDRNRELLVAALQPWQKAIMGVGFRSPGTKPVNGQPWYPPTKPKQMPVEGAGFEGGGLARDPNWIRQYVR